MKNVFLVRSIIDLDYNLALINSFDNCELWLRRRFELKSIFHLIGRDIKIVNLFRFNKFSKILNLNNLLFKYFFTKNLKRCTTGSRFFIDHDWNRDIFTIINLIREHNSNAVIILIPHGLNLFQNRILDYNIYDDEVIDISKIDYDHFISNDPNFQRMYRLNNTRNNVYLPSWRYTYFEVSLRYSNLIKDSNNRVILYHTKRIGNIDWQNLIRSIRIINKHTNFELFIKPHPRGGYKEARQLILNNSKNSIINSKVGHFAVDNFQFYFVLSSTVILDLLFLNKNVVILTYVTGNVFREDILKRCIVINTPEDLIHFCKSPYSRINQIDFNFGVDFNKIEFIEALK